MQACRALVEDDAEREKISTGIDRSPFELFRRHVGDGADDGAWERHDRCGCIRGSIGARETEVEDLQATLGRAHDVLRLQVAMRDALSMCRLECRRQFPRR